MALIDDAQEFIDEENQFDDPDDFEHEDAIQCVANPEHGEDVTIPYNEYLKMVAFQSIAINMMIESGKCAMNDMFDDFPEDFLIALERLGVATNILALGSQEVSSRVH